MDKTSIDPEASNSNKRSVSTMKFSKILLFSSSLTAAFAQIQQHIDVSDIKIDTTQNDDSVEEKADSMIEPDVQEEPKIAKFLIEYDVVEAEKKNSKGIVEAHKGEEITFFYNFTNQEDSDVNVFGIGGSIIEPSSGQVIAQIPLAEFSPLYVAVNESTRFKQLLPVNLHEGIFYVIPHVYVNKEGEEMTVAAAGSAIQVVPPPMSIFNPQFLSIQVFFLAIIASVSYYVFGFSLNSSKEKPAKKQAKANPIEEWLPETHKK